MLTPIRNHSISDWQNFMFGSLAYMAVIVVSFLFLAIVSHIILNSVSSININFLLQATENAGRAGGIAPIIVSTFWLLMICLIVTVPIGLGTALLLTEVTTTNSFLQRFLSGSLNLLAGVPSIVFGLFGNAFFSKTLGMGFSILSGGLTLACMSLPLFIRTAEIGLRSVPEDFRWGSVALGYSHWTTLKKIILPVATPGLLAGLILAIGRALAETAALIFTSGYVDRMPESMLDSGRALSVHIYDLAMNVPGGDNNAYKSALVLIIVVLIVNYMALKVANKVLLKNRGEN